MSMVNGWGDDMAAAAAAVATVPVTFVCTGVTSFAPITMLCRFIVPMGIIQVTGGVWGCVEHRWLHPDVQGSSAPLCLYMRRSAAASLQGADVIVGRWISANLIPATIGELRRNAPSQHAMWACFLPSRSESQTLNIMFARQYLLL